MVGWFFWCRPGSADLKRACSCVYSKLADFWGLTSLGWLTRRSGVWWFSQLGPTGVTGHRVSSRLAEACEHGCCRVPGEWVKAWSPRKAQVRHQHFATSPASYGPEYKARPHSGNEEIVSTFNGRTWKSKGMDIRRHDKGERNYFLKKILGEYTSKLRNLNKVTWLVSSRERIWALIFRLKTSLFQHFSLLADWSM